MTDIHDWINKLKPLAMAVSQNSYSPYSGFKVGAALVCDNGRTQVGCNFENASFGLTQCAERNAIGAAISAGEVREAAVLDHIERPERLLGDREGAGAIPEDRLSDQVPQEPSRAFGFPAKLVSRLIVDEAMAVPV